MIEKIIFYFIIVVSVFASIVVITCISYTIPKITKDSLPEPSPGVKRPMPKEIKNKELNIVYMEEKI